MIEGLPLILLIGFLVVFFLYGNRLEGSGAGQDWSIAWVLLYVSSLVTEGPGASLEVPKALGHTVGTLCFAFLLRGAYSFNELKMPTWLLPTVFVVGLGRAGLELMGATSALWITGLAAEIPMISVAAYLIWAKGQHSNVEKALALSMGGIGLCSALHSITSLLGDAPDLVIAGYLGGAVLGAMMQLAAVLERVRTRQQALLTEHAAQTRELDALVEAVPAGILMVGKQSDVRRMNRRLAELIAVDDRASFAGKRGTRGHPPQPLTPGPAQPAAPAGTLCWNRQRG